MYWAIVAGSAIGFAALIVWRLISAVRAESRATSSLAALASELDALRRANADKDLKIDILQNNERVSSLNLGHVDRVRAWHERVQAALRDRDDNGVLAPSTGASEGDSRAIGPEGDTEPNARSMVGIPRANAGRGSGGNSGER